MVEISTRLHSDYRPEAEATLAALCQSYPRVKLRALELYDPEPGDRSLGHCASGGTIALNAFWFAEPKSKLDAAVARGREVEPQGAMAWHGRIGGIEDEFSRLLSHEFGHLLMAATPGADEFAREGAAAALADHALATSGYALADDDRSGSEWFADTFAGFRFGGAGPQVGELGEFLGQRDQKRAKDAVDYEARAKIPDRRCGLCRFFEEPDGCAMVAGVISPRGWCRLFEREI